MDTADLKKVVIVDDADLIFVCEGVALHVSSQVLRSASPVFAVMLGPNFAEGQALLNADKGAPATLLLPDDDAEGIELLCYAVHHQKWRQTSDDITDSIMRFADTVDKYNCCAAVEGILNPVIYSLEPSGEETAHLAEAICMLDDPTLFRMYTSFLIESNRHKEVDDEELKYGMEGLYGKACLGAGRNHKLTLYIEALCQRERDAAKFLAQEIDQVVDCILPGFIRCHSMNPGGGYARDDDEARCDYDQRAAGRYLELFMAHCLWPSSARFPFGRLVEGIRDIVIPELREIQGCGIQWGEDLGRWADDGKRFLEIVNPKIGMLKQLAENLRVGLCLDCFKANGAPHGPCRVPHDEFTSAGNQGLEFLDDMDMERDGNDE